MGKRADAKVLYHTSLPVLFGVKKYADALWEQVSPPFQILFKPVVLNLFESAAHLFS